MMTSPTPWRIQLFGALQITSGEQTITRFRTQMTGSLLAYLAFYKGRPQPREVLIEQFWSDADPKSGRGRLSVALSSLRAQFPPQEGSPELLVTDSFTVALNPALFDTDVQAFQNALKRARRTLDPVERAQHLEEALTYYVDDLLLGRYESWIQPEQAQLREQFESAKAELAALRKNNASTAVARSSGNTAPTSSPAPGTYTALLAAGDSEEIAAMRAVVEKYHGAVFTSTPESSCFIFTDVNAALSAAVACRRASPATTRFALDTGFLDTTDRSIQSPQLRPLHQLLQTVHPGQILCSDATASLVGRHSQSDSEYRLRDLGRFRVAGDGAAERLFQVEGASEPPLLFPAPLAAQGDAPMLPLTYTRFFGRESELTQLSEMLAAAPATPSMITLTGIGGIGKTRLAHEAASRALHAFNGRVWFVALADLQNLDAERIPDAIRDSLRLPNDPGLDAMDQCAIFLGAAPSLLVLDNMEQFVAGGHAVEILQTLRARVPSLTYLVTSRQVLGMEGERAFPVGPLLDPDATAPAKPEADPEHVVADIRAEASVLLFEDRARAVRPDFRVSVTNYPVLLRLCQILEGIPLAIELAAARIALLSPPQILAQMESRFALLRSRRRDIPERHRSLWASIDSSFQLLSPELQRVFARLSVFRGGWTLEAVQAVCLDQDTQDAVEFAALEAIAELQEASLIFAVEGEGNVPRFQMLETLREYAGQQLAQEGNEQETRQRHADFFAALALRTEPRLSVGQDAQNWLDLLARDHDNLRLAIETQNSPVRALQTAVAIHRFWLIRGYVSEGRRRLLALLENPKAITNTSLPEQAKAHNALGVLSWAAGLMSEAEKHYNIALDFYRSSGEQDNIARALNNLAIVSTQNGNFAAARFSYEESLSLYRKLGDTLRQSMVLTNLGGVLVFLQDYDAARVVLEESLPIQRAAQDSYTISRTLLNLSEVAFRQKDTVVAARALHESMEIRQAIEDQSNHADVLASAAAIMEQYGRMDDAAILWAAARSLRISYGTVAPPANAAHEHLLSEQIRLAIPEDVLQQMEQKGGSMDFAQSLSYALQSLGEII